MWTLNGGSGGGHCGRGFGAAGSAGSCALCLPLYVCLLTMQRKKTPSVFEHAIVKRLSRSPESKKQEVDL